MSHFAEIEEFYKRLADVCKLSLKDGTQEAPASSIAKEGDSIVVHLRAGRLGKEALEKVVGYMRDAGIEAKSRYPAILATKAPEYKAVLADDEVSLKKIQSAYRQATVDKGAQDIAQAAGFNPAPGSHGAKHRPQRGEKPSSNEL